MRELSSSAFPLGETSLHLLHTPDGNMFVTADLAVKLFDSAPATFAEFVRANRYVRVNAMERAVVRLCASLGIPPETAGGDKPVPVAAAAVARDETVREDPNAKGGSANADAAGPKDAVTLLPEKTVLAILEDRRAPRRAQFRETAARRSFVAAERLARQGAFADALPLALDAVRRAQDIRDPARGGWRRRRRRRRAARVLLRIPLRREEKPARNLRDEYGRNVRAARRAVRAVPARRLDHARARQDGGVRQPARARVVDRAAAGRRRLGNAKGEAEAPARRVAVAAGENAGCAGGVRFRGGARRGGLRAADPARRPRALQARRCVQGDPRGGPRPRR